MSMAVLIMVILINLRENTVDLKLLMSMYEDMHASKTRRELKENQPTVAKFDVNIQNRLNPPLPQNYFGNALAPTVIPTCYVGEIINHISAVELHDAEEKGSSGKSEH
ncbi:Anthranilate N-benzoyltransferase protein [Arachis hypogaea]|nr:Anthranilate N-benzoyltransferase protein [Arachis hypogaea]